MTTGKDSDIYKKTAARLVAATECGIKISALSNATKINYHKLSSVAFGDRRKCYGYSASLTDDECARINNALDNIKNAI